MKKINKKTNRKDIALTFELCKSIARHMSQIEAEKTNSPQSTERYLELKSMLMTHFLQCDDNVDKIIEEFEKCLEGVGDFDENGVAVPKSPLNHVICTLMYFIQLYNNNLKE